MKDRQKAVQLYRGQTPSPGAPTVAWREDRVRFWAAIAKGIKTEGAAVDAETKGQIGRVKVFDGLLGRLDAEVG